MTTATSLQPGTLLQQREIYLSILKDLSIMDDIFMRNVLKDSACTDIIFITENDTLGFNLPICHINRTFEEAGQPCPDQLHIIYVNSSFQDDTTLGRLMHDLHCSDPHDMYSKILAQRVIELKETQKGVDIMCDKLNELITEERNEGEKRGILNTQKEMAKNLRHMGMALEQISLALNVSV